MQINEVQVVVPQSVPNTANTGTAGEVVSGSSKGLAPVAIPLPKVSSQAPEKSTTATADSPAQGREQQSGTDLADLISENRENLIADLRAFFYVQDTGKVVIHVVDGEDQLVRQFPADALLELAEFMGKMIDHLFDEVV